MRWRKMVNPKHIDKLSFGTITGDGKSELSLEEDTLKKLENPAYDLEKEKEEKDSKLFEAYLNIMDLLQKYCDLNKQDYPLIATWIIGTYFHKTFHSYPYLFLNAMKGSGKTRMLKLITDLSKDGEILLQPTEAVLFRTTGTLGIDEAEGIARKGMENLRELLNGCYKRGTKVKRMKQKKNEEGNTEQVVEEFEIYRPLALANINGMEDVLGDRCINIILERSTNPKIIRLAEIWQEEEIFIKTKKLLNECIECNVVVAEKVYRDWNEFTLHNYIYNTHYTNYINYTPLFKSLNLMELTGREVELCLPLLILGWNISEKVYLSLHKSIKDYMKDRKQDQFNDSRDIMLIDMVSQEPEESFQQVKIVVKKFLEFTQEENEYNEINTKWMGIALKRLKLVKEKKRLAGGVYVKLDYANAQEKIKQYK